MKKFQFKINEKYYEVELIKIEDTTGGYVNTSMPVQQPVTTTAPVATPTPVAQPQPEAEVKAAPVSGKVSGHVLSPLPGLVRGISVKPGDRIKNGDTVLILEAMKMENNIFADRDGVVLEILVNSGDPVLEGDKLIALGD